MSRDDTKNLSDDNLLLAMTVISEMTMTMLVMILTTLEEDAVDDSGKMYDNVDD